MQIHQRAVTIAASDSSPVGFDVILLLYFENGAATLAKRSSFYTCTESVRGSRVNTDQQESVWTVRSRMLFAHDLNISSIVGMCERGSSRASPVVAPACVKGVSELDISVSCY